MKKNKRYFVSYAYEEGFGQVEINCPKNLTLRENVREFRNIIIKKGKVKDLIILFFKEI